jgi:broad-specificity NMP kinase
VPKGSNIDADKKARQLALQAAIAERDQFIERFAATLWNQNDLLVVLRAHLFGEQA